ncbi:MarR family winged helix-turn-helix transcriptional regulator [Hydrogenophaga pseudoflava]|uniref:MarR family protein n=1 Tax=Hydrogenophaga pseudoflava TaxID=47421 RepID=A0A4P6WW46_HYDPS|nr:MarR family winged helix-turn-helix transcriptional regulator [Hydrogenophaga pseudoflava]QBM27777.1 MarR family protein [Hydrogenophaga pseudoflava]
MAASTTPKSLPQGCTNLKLRQFMRRVAQFYDAEMAQVGLKTTQYSLLSYVDKLGPVRPGELAEGLKMDASTLTRNLRPLVDAGWVVVAAGEDARSRLVSLTPAGREKRAEAKRRWKVAQLGINRLLGEDQVVALHALIDASMDKLAPVAARGEGDE